MELPRAGHSFGAACAAPSAGRDRPRRRVGAPEVVAPGGMARLVAFAPDPLLHDADHLAAVEPGRRRIDGGDLVADAGEKPLEPAIIGRGMLVRLPGQTARRSGHIRRAAYVERPHARNDRPASKLDSASPSSRSGRSKASVVPCGVRAGTSAQPPSHAEVDGCANVGAGANRPSSSLANATFGVLASAPAGRARSLRSRRSTGEGG